MVLKEAFQYQNFLHDKLVNIQEILIEEGNVMCIKEEHNISHLIKEQEDKVLETKALEDYDFNVNNLIDLLADIVYEKEKLTNKISEVKKSAELDIDGIIAINKDKLQVSRTLEFLSKLKSKETETVGRTYTFNGEGNQIQVVYPVKRIQTIDYDRNVVKNLYKNIKKEVENSSLKRDEILLLTELDDFVPKYLDADSVEEMMEIFLKN